MIEHLLANGFVADKVKRYEVLGEVKCLDAFKEQLSEAISRLIALTKEKREFKIVSTTDIRITGVFCTYGTLNGQRVRFICKYIPTEQCHYMAIEREMV